MSELRDVMIDLETMGTKPDAPIVSIGAVLFDPRRGKTCSKTFYEELDWENQDRIISLDTKRWWAKQSTAARECLFGMEELPDVLGKFSEWLPGDVKVWGNGPTFDISILENAYHQSDLKIPWKHWNVRDCRTIKDLYESARGGFDGKVSGTAHNALDDARHQAEYVSMMWNSLLSDDLS